MDSKINYYDILDVLPSATTEQIRHAFRVRAMKCHPDRGGSHQQMVLVCEAGEVLLDARKRGLYDEFLRGSGATASASWSQVRQEARKTATQYPKHEEAFLTWLDRAAGEVQQNRAGRLFSGLIAGVIVGAVLGAVVGWWFGIGVQGGLMIGLPTVGLVGAIAGATNEAVPRKPA